MAVFDPTTLNLILAGEKAPALARLDGGQPTEYQETIGATVERVSAQLRSTSGTSETIGAGPLTFVLDDFLGWKQGDQVFISEDGDPENNYITGSLAADQLPGGDITVTVNATQGSGTFTAWSLLLTVFVTATTVAPPVGLADGGWGADLSTLAGRVTGRDLTEVAWTVSVRDFDVADPTATDAWGDGDFGHVASSGTLGAFIGHEEGIFQRVTLGVFTFIDTAVLRNGDQAFEGDYGVGGLGQKRRYYNTDQSQWVPKELPQGFSHGQVTGGSNGISVSPELDRLLSFELSGLGAVLTLPVTTDWGSSLPLIILFSDDANVKTVNVTAGGTINGSTSLTFSGAYASRTLIVDAVAGEYIITASQP